MSTFSWNLSYMCLSYISFGVNIPLNISNNICAVRDQNAVRHTQTNLCCLLGTGVLHMVIHL